jgi:hypothetical protein
MSRASAKRYSLLAGRQVIAMPERSMRGVVDDLTRAYGGRLMLSDSDMGGLKAVLELPAAQVD